MPFSLERHLRNRANAQHSTDPRTPQGKLVVRLNAVTHGLYTQEVLLPGEDGALLRELARSLRDTLQPEGALEDLLVERLIAQSWRLRRVLTIERIFLTAGASGVVDYDEMLSRAYLLWKTATLDSAITKQESALERSLYRTLGELRRVQDERQGRPRAVVPLTPLRR